MTRMMVNVMLDCPDMTVTILAMISLLPGSLRSAGRAPCVPSARAHCPQPTKAPPRKAQEIAREPRPEAGIRDSAGAIAMEAG
jgi:hypothetical protein